MYKSLKYVATLLIVLNCQIYQIQCRSAIVKRDAIESGKQSWWSTLLAPWSNSDNSSEEEHIKILDVTKSSLSTTSNAAIDIISSTDAENKNIPSEPETLLTTTYSIPLAEISTTDGSIFSLVAESQVTTEAVSNPSPMELDEQLPIDADNFMNEKVIKITPFSRKQFRVRKNCRCVIHGRCARVSLCE